MIKEKDSFILKTYQNYKKIIYSTDNSDIFLKKLSLRFKRDEVIGLKYYQWYAVKDGEIQREGVDHAIDIPSNTKNILESSTPSAVEYDSLSILKNKRKKIEKKIYALCFYPLNPVHMVPYLISKSYVTAGYISIEIISYILLFLKGTVLIKDESNYLVLYSYLYRYKKKITSINKVKDKGYLREYSHLIGTLENSPTDRDMGDNSKEAVSVDCDGSFDTLVLVNCSDIFNLLDLYLLRCKRKLVLYFSLREEGVVLYEYLVKKNVKNISIVDILRREMQVNEYGSRPEMSGRMGGGYVLTGNIKNIVEG